MDNIQKYDYWQDIADYDLETARAMLVSGRYLYVVFMCQQSVEKLSQAVDQSEAAAVLASTEEVCLWLKSLKQYA